MNDNAIFDYFEKKLNAETPGREEYLKRHEHLIKNPRYFGSNGVLLVGSHPTKEILLGAPNSYVKGLRMLPNTEAPYYNSYGHDRYDGLYDCPRDIQLMPSPQPTLNSKGEIIFPKSIYARANKYTGVQENYVYHSDFGR